MPGEEGFSPSSTRCLATNYIKINCWIFGIISNSTEIALLDIDIEIKLTKNNLAISAVHHN